MKRRPTLSCEFAACQALDRSPVEAWIAGVDEAGRGALAGPVTAAAVILPLADDERLAGLAEVNDSKQLTPAQRERLFDLICEHALSYAVASRPNDAIDRSGILPATRLAMVDALSRLDPPPHFALIDGRIRLKTIPLPQQALVRGDGRSLSIAAASVLAKVTRDRWMVEQDACYPAYGFARHKGYGTPGHLAALAEHGPSPLHRRSFAPLKHTLSL